MTAAAGRPQGAILLSSYQQLDQFVRAFADGQLNLLFLLGRPGPARLDSAIAYEHAITGPEFSPELAGCRGEGEVTVLS